jgi:uncharacterized phage-associated protein
MPPGTWLVKCEHSFDKIEPEEPGMTTLDQTKLRELILYIAERSEGDEPFGKTKLNKILFYADFIAYAQMGRSITGQEYRKLPHGPVAADAEETLTALKQEEAVAIAQRSYHGLPQQRPFALREPILDAFSGEEIAIVDKVITELWGKSAKDVSDLSHEFIGWQAALPGEAIPYETVFVDNGELTEAEEEYARQLAQAGR